MIVYVLQLDIHYEGDELLSIHRTEEGAKKALLEEVDRRTYPKDHPLFRCNFTISSGGREAEARGESLTIFPMEVEE